METFLGLTKEEERYMTLRVAFERIDPTLTAAHAASSQLVSPQAREHLELGACRRLHIISLSFLPLWEPSSPGRVAPLTMSEASEMSLHLNSIYLHMRGLVDNLAWLLAYELGHVGKIEETFSHFRKVDLFGEEFLQGLSSLKPQLEATIRMHSLWWSSLKQVRDPVAHRLPVYAVPAQNTSGPEGERYRPHFAQSPHRRETAYDLHEQVAKDLETTVNIFMAVLESFQQERSTT